jgi:predicted ArsR family transcriptional regulator
MTATELGERIGESPTTCSFHLRQLAKYDFVEEACGGKGRARPWRIRAIGLDISGRDNPEAETAENALIQVVRHRYLDRYRTWLETRATYPKQWRAAAGDTELIFYVTVEELKTLRDDVLELLLPRYLDRLEDPTKRPPGPAPVEMLVFTYPLSLPQGSDQ